MSVLFNKGHLYSSFSRLFCTKVKNFSAACFFYLIQTVRKEVSVLENERNTHDSILYLKQNKTKQSKPKLTVVNFRSYFILFALQNHLLIYLE